MTVVCVLGSLITRRNPVMFWRPLPFEFLLEALVMLVNLLFLLHQASHIFVNNVGEIVIPEAFVLQTLDGEVLQEIYHR